jgi:sulfopropanediol 3-dehydrogenase
MAVYLKQPQHHPGEDAAAIETTVREIIARVHDDGLKAVRAYSERFDHWSPRSFRVARDEIDESTRSVAPDLRRQIDFAAEQIRAFAMAERATMTDLEIQTMPGVILGHRHIPVASVGSYSPGGLYPLIASS